MNWSAGESLPNHIPEASASLNTCPGCKTSQERTTIHMHPCSGKLCCMGQPRADRGILYVMEAKPAFL